MSQGHLGCYLPQDGLTLEGRVPVFAECMSVFDDIAPWSGGLEALTRSMADLSHESAE